MATMGSVPVVGNPEGAISRCQLCGNMRQTTLVKFQRNIGMVILRQTRTIQGYMCKSCVGKKFWEFTGLNHLLGPWGMISIIVTPIYLIMNIAAYASAAKRLSGALE